MESNAAHRLTGRHIVTMVVAVCVAVVLAPVGVFAAAHAQRVSIVDPEHANRGTHVTKTGREEVTATVTGAVTSQETAPAKPFVLSFSADGAIVYATLPKGHNVVIQTISADGQPGGSGDDAGIRAYYKWHDVTAEVALPLSDVNGDRLFGTASGPFYANGGSTMEVIEASNHDGQFNVINNITVTGYTT